MLQGCQREARSSEGPSKYPRGPRGLPGLLPEPGAGLTGMSPPGVEGPTPDSLGLQRGPPARSPSPPAAGPTLALLPSRAHLLFSRHVSPCPGWTRVFSAGDVCTCVLSHVCEGTQWSVWQFAQGRAMCQSLRHTRRWPHLGQDGVPAMPSLERHGCSYQEERIKLNKSVPSETGMGLGRHSPEGSHPTPL